MGLLVQELPRPAQLLAGRAFLRYRREGGNKSNVLPDFFRAHAAVQSWDVLTRDTRRYCSYFPTVALITPHAT